MQKQIDKNDTIVTTTNIYRERALELYILYRDSILWRIHVVTNFHHPTGVSLRGTFGDHSACEAQIRVSSQLIDLNHCMANASLCKIILETRRG